jgi:hypothetical protein
MDKLGQAYKAGKGFGRIILDVYGDKSHWMRMKSAQVAKSENYAFLRMIFGVVDQHMEAEYVRGFEETLGLTDADRENRCSAGAMETGSSEAQ